MKCESLSKMCMCVLIVKSLIIIAGRSLLSVEDFMVIMHGRSNHVFDEDCFGISMDVGYKSMFNT